MTELHAAAYRVLALLEEGGADVPDPDGAIELLSYELGVLAPSARPRLVESAMYLAYWLAHDKGAVELGKRIVEVVAPELPADVFAPRRPGGDAFERRTTRPRGPRAAPRWPFSARPPPTRVRRDVEIQRRILADRLRRPS